MGEKEGKGEEKQKKSEGGGGGPATVVLKVDLHCEGCALKVKRSVKRLDGVEKVSVDTAGNKLTVVGKVDPVMLRERVEEKTRNKVEIVSSAGCTAKPKDGGGDTKKPAADGDNKKPAAAAAGGGGAKEAKKSADEKKPADEKKAKAPQVSTVVLKIRLHCEGCINKIRKTIYKIKGVDDVFVDASKDIVTVKGTMDPKILPSILKDKLKRGVEVVPSKKDDGGGDKKGEKEGGGGKKETGDGDKKKDSRGDGGNKKEGEKKKEGEGGGGDKSVKKEVDKAPPTKTMKKMEYYGSYGYPVEIAPESYGYRVEMGSTSYDYGADMPHAPHEYRYETTQIPHGYGVDMAHAPQMFSDENPNACSIM